jgi:hypothetical protein
MNWKLIVTLDAETASALHGEHPPDEIPNSLAEMAFDEFHLDFLYRAGMTVEEGDCIEDGEEGNKFPYIFDFPDLPNDSEIRTIAHRAGEAQRNIGKMLETSIAINTDYS